MIVTNNNKMKHQNLVVLQNIGHYLSVRDNFRLAQTCQALRRKMNKLELFVTVRDLKQFQKYHSEVDTQKPIHSWNCFFRLIVTLILLYLSAIHLSSIGWSLLLVPYFISHITIHVLSYHHKISCLLIIIQLLLQLCLWTPYQTQNLFSCLVGLACIVFVVKTSISPKRDVVHVNSWLPLLKESIYHANAASIGLFLINQYYARLDTITMTDLLMRCVLEDNIEMFTVFKSKTRAVNQCTFKHNDITAFSYDLETLIWIYILEHDRIQIFKHLIQTQDFTHHAWLTYFKPPRITQYLTEAQLNL